MNSSYRRGMAGCLVAIPLLTALTGQVAAQALTFAGLAVEADVHRDQDIRRQGRALSIQAHQNWVFSIEADKSINVTVVTTFRSPAGTRKAKPNTGTFTLDRTLDVASRGGGSAVWNFADGALTFVRTFPSGAYRAQFAFVRGDAGMTCTVTEAFARENGRNGITVESPFGGEVTIIKSTQTSSTCTVKPPKS